MGELLAQGCFLVVLFSGVPLIVSSLCGLVVSILQAATQVSEQSLSFLVRFSVIGILLYISSGWCVHELTKFFELSFGGIRALGHMP